MSRAAQPASLLAKILALVGGAMATPPGHGSVIEGEAIVVEEYRVDRMSVLPDDSGRSGPV